jgi:hypothetical protein
MTTSHYKLGDGLIYGERKMRELTNQEMKLLNRYVHLVRQHDRFVLFRRARESSNAMLDSAEAAIPKQDPSDYDLTYLQGISRRKSKNYRKLRGMKHILRVIDLLKTKTLADLGIGEDA